MSASSSKTKKVKGPQSNFLKSLIVFLFVAGSFAFLARVAYQEFVIWDATNYTEDHSWYNLAIYPLTPTVSDTTAFNSLQKNPNMVHIDVRSSAEFANGHIPGAINIPEENLHSVIPQKFGDKNQLIYLNCNTGHKGAVSTRLLRSLGYTNAWNIADGLEGWESFGYLTAQ